MADVVDSATRSRMMAGIKGKDTKPEMALRRALHAMGFRFRLHVKNLPGRPDLVLPRFRAVVLVHGCFWHRHAGCRYCTTPATRTEFWDEKFRANVARDQRNIAELRSADWRIAIVWECSLRGQSAVEAVENLGSWIRSRDSEFTTQQVPR